MLQTKTSSVLTNFIQHQKRLVWRRTGGKDATSRSQLVELSSGAYLYLQFSALYQRAVGVSSANKHRVAIRAVPGSKLTATPYSSLMHGLGKDLTYLLY